MSMAFAADKPSLSEQIHKALGFYKFMYYRYVDTFKNNPLDIDDLVDGLIFIHLSSQSDES